MRTGTSGSMEAWGPSWRRTLFSGGVTSTWIPRATCGRGPSGAPRSARSFPPLPDKIKILRDKRQLNKKELRILGLRND